MGQWECSTAPQIKIESYPSSRANPSAGRAGLATGQEEKQDFSFGVGADHRFGRNFWVGEKSASGKLIKCDTKKYV